MEETRKDTLRRLFTENNLVKEDVFKHPTQGWTIIKRTGVDKIQAKNNIHIKYEIQNLAEDHSYCLLKATGTMRTGGDKYKEIESYGECSPKNNKNSYPVSIAEKRAMSRVVLKLAGFYELGIYAEEESEDFKQPK